MTSQSPQSLVHSLMMAIWDRRANILDSTLEDLGVDGLNA